MDYSNRMQASFDKMKQYILEQQAANEQMAKVVGPATKQIREMEERTREIRRRLNGEG